MLTRTGVPGRWANGRGCRGSMCTKRYMRSFCLFCLVLLLTCTVSGQDLDYYSRVLSSGNTEAKRTVLLEITNGGDEATARIAVKALSDKSEIVRASAASAINALSPAEAATVLLPLLKDKAPFVRKEAAYALGRTAHPSAAAGLIDRLRSDKDYEVRCAAAVALGQVGSEADMSALAGVLSKSPSEDNEFIRRAASHSIGQIAGSIGRSLVNRQIAPILIKALSNSREADDTRREAAFALGMIGDPAALPVLYAQLRSPDPYLVERTKKSIELIERGR
jgi:HEAT repeat protein